MRIQTLDQIKKHLKTIYFAYILFCYLGPEGPKGESGSVSEKGKKFTKMNTFSGRKLSFYHYDYYILISKVKRVNKAYQDYAAKEVLMERQVKQAKRVMLVFQDLVDQGQWVS